MFANGASVEFSRIAQALEISEKKVKEHISALIDDYEASGRGITIILLDNSQNFAVGRFRDHADQIGIVKFAGSRFVARASVGAVLNADCPETAEF